MQNNDNESVFVIISLRQFSYDYFSVICFTLLVNISYHCYHSYSYD